MKAMAYVSPAKDPFSKWLDPLDGTELTPILISRITDILQNSEFTLHQVVYCLAQIRKIISYEQKKTTK
jgi:hypothetical protein